jgi:hypothetical protein
MLKVGQKVRYKADKVYETPSFVPRGTIFTIKIVDKNGVGYIFHKDEHDSGNNYGDYRWSVREESVDIIEEASVLTAELTKEVTHMSIVAKFKLALTPEPEKSFIQKGVMNERQELTADGRALFEVFMLDKFKTEFKTEVVDKIEVEDKK